MKFGYFFVNDNHCLLGKHKLPSQQLRKFIREACLLQVLGQVRDYWRHFVEIMAVPSLLTWEGLLLFLGFIHIQGFNVDVRMPFIKQGPENSYFGFSIAQHKINTSGEYL